MLSLKLCFFFKVTKKSDLKLKSDSISPKQNLGISSYRKKNPNTKASPQNVQKSKLPSAISMLGLVDATSPVVLLLASVLSEIGCAPI